MSEIRSVDTRSNWHYGTLGCFLQDENGSFYGVTCRHVTLSASDGVIYISNGTIGFSSFGKALERHDEFDIYKDIDVFEVDFEKRSDCDFFPMNKFGQRCQFNECSADLSTGADVFMWRKYSTNNETRSMKCIFGKILRRYKYESVFRESENVFLFSSEEVVEGDSGNALLMEKGENVCIVGFVLGGKFEFENKKYNMFLEFKHGMKILSDIYQKSFIIPSFELSEQKYLEFNIKPGFVIWVKSPENVAKTDFDLFNHVMLLIDCFNNQFCPNITRLENSFEEQLSKHVNARNENIHKIQRGTDDENCFLECMRGCDYMYSGKIQLSQIHLKEAVRILPKTSCRNRLLCKLITYSTWLLLELDKLNEMQKLLEDGVTYLLKMKECNSCPLKSIGYHYFDYARFFNAKHKYDKALEMAKTSLEYFQNDEEHRGKASHGKYFALAMIARMNLLCGVNFETRHLPMRDLQEAEESVRDIERMGVLPAVERTSFLLLKADLLYRKGEIENAMALSKDCYQDAAKNKLTQEMKGAVARLKELVRICKREK